MTLPIAPLTAIVAAVLGNHLWQSALLVAVIAIVSLAFHPHRAPIRYALWWAASLKFLIPFAPLIALGGWAATGRPALVQPQAMFVVDTLVQPLSWGEPPLDPTPAASMSVERNGHLLMLLLFTVWVGGAAVTLWVWYLRWRRVAIWVRRGATPQGGRELDILRHVERIARIQTPTVLISSETRFEPGVFGILKPVLLWPRSLSHRLTDGQIAAIFAHELCHVRRRDNLAAAVHMIVEAVFWMHPLVWWLGDRLVEEREHACDEEVLRLGFEPRVYAESILRTCRFSIESPLECIAGVTGADLEVRIVRIVRNRPSEPLTRRNRILLTIAAFLILAGPAAVGFLNAPRLRAESLKTPADPNEMEVDSARAPDAASGLPAGFTGGLPADRWPDAAASWPAFEVASVKRNMSGDLTVIPTMIGADGRFDAYNATLKNLIQGAYGVLEPQISGGPGWIDSSRFNIVARTERAGASREQMLQMVRALLADRFKLRIHAATQERQIYALVLARKDRRLGPQLRPSSSDCAQPPATGGVFALRPLGQGCGFEQMSGRISGRGYTMDLVAGGFASLVNRVVVNRTGLRGSFDLDLQYAPEFGAFVPSDAPANERPPNTAPSIFAAVQEQLGLKLEAQRGAVDMLVIESAEQPTSD